MTTIPVTVRDVATGRLRNSQPGDTISVATLQNDVRSLTNGSSGSITIGTPVYSSAIDTVSPAAANASGTAEVIGLVADANISNGVAGNIQTSGILVATAAQWNAIVGGSSGLSYGTDYFLSNTTGLLTSTVPVTASDYSVFVGTGLSSTELALKIGTPYLM